MYTPRSGMQAGFLYATVSGIQGISQRLWRSGFYTIWSATFVPPHPKPKRWKDDCYQCDCTIIRLAVHCLQYCGSANASSSTNTFLWQPRGRTEPSTQLLGNTSFIATSMLFWEKILKGIKNKMDVIHQPFLQSPLTPFWLWLIDWFWHSPMFSYLGFVPSLGQNLQTCKSSLMHIWVQAFFLYFIL